MRCDFRPLQEAFMHSYLLSFRLTPSVPVLGVSEGYLYRVIHMVPILGTLFRLLTTLLLTLKPEP